MQRVDISLGLDRNRLDTQLLASPDNPNGNLAAIGNKYFMKHEGEPRFSKLFHLSCLSGQGMKLKFLDYKQWITEFYRLSIVFADLYDLAFTLGLNLVHQFHCLYDT